MMIKQIDKIPDGESKTDKYSKARKDLVEDIMTIIRDNIPYCEVTLDAYSDNYKRSLIDWAIRCAVSKVKRQAGIVVDWLNDFRIVSCKDADGKRHWYIEYKKAVTDKNG